MKRNYLTNPLNDAVIQTYYRKGRRNGFLAGALVGAWLAVFVVAVVAGWTV